MKYRSQNEEPLALAPEASEVKGAIAEYTQHVSDTQKLRRLPDENTAAFIIRDEFRRRAIEVENVVLYTAERGRQMCMTFFGHAGSPETRDITPRGYMP